MPKLVRDIDKWGEEVERKAKEAGVSTSNASIIGWIMLYAILGASLGFWGLMIAGAISLVVVIRKANKSGK